MRKLLMQLLPLTGLAEFQFIEAEDGMEALARFSSGKIDIVFVDWNLPRLAGIDLVRKIRTTGTASGAGARGDQIPIVMVTGNCTTGNVADALDGAGADVYVTKPYTVDELRRKLTKVIERMATERREQPAINRAGILTRLLGRSD